MKQDFFESTFLTVNIFQSENKKLKKMERKFFFLFFANDHQNTELYLHKNIETSKKFAEEMKSFLDVEEIEVYENQKTKEIIDRFNVTQKNLCENVNCNFI